MSEINGLKPSEVREDGADWRLPNVIADRLTRVIAWRDGGETGVGIMTWLSAVHMTAADARALGTRLIAAADYSDRLAADPAAR